MLKLIVEKELKEIISSQKFILTFCVSSFLIVLSFYVGANNYFINQSQYEAAKLENIRAMEGIKDWRMVEHNIFLPPNPLASLVSGISNDIGRNIDLHGRGELVPMESKYNENPLYAAFRFLDLNFIFQIVLSLFAILFTFNSVNGEKENGTLRLIFSNSIPRDTFILGKMLGSYIGLTIPLLIPFLAGCLILLILGVPMSNSEWISLMAIILTGYLFMGVYIALSVFISSITKKSASSFLILLIIWIFAILVIPRVSILVAGRTIDVPSIDEINSQKHAYNIELSEMHMKKLGEFKPTQGSENMFEDFQKFMESANMERDEKMNEFASKLNEERQNRQAVQSKLSLALARFSPAAEFSLATSELAGTSLSLANHFAQQARNYQKVYREFQQEKSGGSSGGGMVLIMIRNDEETKNIDPTELPKFEYSTPALEQRIVNAAFDLSLLAVFNLLFFAGAFFTFLKFDLR